MVKGLFSITGGKMVKAKHLKEIWNTSYNTWIEPFIGGGSIFVAERPKKAIINDFNPFIVRLWEWVKETPKEELSKANEDRIDFYNTKTTEDYNYMRDNLNAEYKRTGKINDLHNFIIIFNAMLGRILYNSNGIYTNALSNRKIHNCYGRLEAVHDILNECSVKMFNKDYKDICKMAKKDDLVALDPPYLDAIGYPRRWRKKDYEELKEVVDNLNHIGAKFFICNVDDEYLRELFKGYDITKYSVHRKLNDDERSKKRNEIIIKNY